MGFFVLSLLFLICSVYAELNEKPDLVADCVEGYYWREYAGDIPRDALPGGLDANGSTIYIGQVLFDQRLLPGQIREAEKSVIYHDANHAQHISTKYIKILCGHHSEDFEWIKTNNSNIRNLTAIHLILGGYDVDPGYTVYIGRLSINGEMLVGMVLVCNTNELGLHIVGDGKATTYVSYEVLSYNPKVRVKSESTKISAAEQKTISDGDREGKCSKNIININVY